MIDKVGVGPELFMAIVIIHIIPRLHAQVEKDDKADHDYTLHKLHYGNEAYLEDQELTVGFRLQIHFPKVIQNQKRRLRQLNNINNNEPCRQNNNDALHFQNLAVILKE